MHSKPMKDSDGVFDEYKSAPNTRCRKCGMIGQVKYRVWESSCGGYEDYNYKCTCSHSWWVDGDDG